MLKLIELQHFRGFEEARLTGLKTINLLTGLNGSGKTSILEAAFLISGAANASLVASLHSFRGEHAWNVGVDRPFRSLFRNLDPDVLPKIVASPSELMKTSARYRRELTIKPIFSVGRGETSTSRPALLKGVTFEFRGPSGKVRSNWGWTAEGEKFLATLPAPQKPKAQRSRSARRQSPPSQPPLDPKMMLGGDPVENPDLIPGQFVSPYVRDILPADHEILTRLLKERRIEEAVAALQLVAPGLKALHPLTENNSPVIYADIGGKTLLPISLLGSGLVNCLHIVLPSLLHKGGIILIDEFEDGIHHTLLTPLLKIVFDLARQRKNLLLITTHSNELLRHIISVAHDQAPDDISFFRLGKLGLKGLIPRYSLSEAESLLDSNIDIR